MQNAKKQKLRQLRKWRIRKKITGTTARPRMSVCFTGEHIYVQFVDDSKGFTMASASTRDKSIAGRESLAANVERIVNSKSVGNLPGYPRQIEAAELAKGFGVPYPPVSVNEGQDKT